MKLKAAARCPHLVESIVRHDFYFGLGSRSGELDEKSVVALQEVRERLEMLTSKELGSISSSLMMGVCGTVSPSTALGATLSYGRSRYMLRGNPALGDVFARTMVSSAMEAVGNLGGVDATRLMAGVLAVADVGRISPDKTMVAFGHLYTQLSPEGQSRASALYGQLFGANPSPKKAIRRFVEEVATQADATSAKYNAVTVALRDSLGLLQPLSPSLVEEGVKAAPADIRGDLRRSLTIAERQGTLYRQSRVNLARTLEMIGEELSGGGI